MTGEERELMKSEFKQYAANLLSALRAQADTDLTRKVITEALLARQAAVADLELSLETL